MELDVGDGNADSSVRMELGASEEGVIQEPYVGMEFDSEEAAKKFYDEYAKRVGFVMRIDQCRRSEVDKRILSRRLSCNKQGYYVKSRDRFGPARKPRSTTREGCKAMMLVKVNKAGKWAVTRFEKEHTHPLVISGHPSHDATSKVAIEPRLFWHQKLHIAGLLLSLSHRRVLFRIAGRVSSIPVHRIAAFVCLSLSHRRASSIPVHHNLQSGSCIVSWIIDHLSSCKWFVCLSLTSQSIVHPSASQPSSVSLSRIAEHRLSQCIASFRVV